MAGVFETSSFEASAFQLGAAAALTITDTSILQNPVDVVLASDVPIKDRYREFDIRPTNFREKVTVRRSGVQSLGGQKPSFTVTTNKRGYD